MSNINSAPGTVSLEQSWSRERSFPLARLAVSADLFLFVYFLMDQVGVSLWAFQASRGLLPRQSLGSCIVFMYFGVWGDWEWGTVLACLLPHFLSPGTSPPLPSHPHLCSAALPGPTTPSHHVIPGLAPALGPKCLLACCSQGGWDSLCQSF